MMAGELEYPYEASDESSENELLDRSLSLWTGWGPIEKKEGYSLVLLDLHTAASIGQYDRVRSIILRGEEDLNRHNQEGWSALMYACYIGHDNIVNLLLDASVKVNGTNKKGQTPLMLAASCGNESVAYFLLQQGAELEAKDNKGWTALFHATYAGHQNMVKFLLDSGSSTKTIDPRRGNTPFMEAAAEGHEIIVQCFLDHGVDVNVKASNGDTARSLALISDHMNIVGLIDNYTMTPRPLQAESVITGPASHKPKRQELSSSDESYQRPRTTSTRTQRSKTKGPRISDGPQALAKIDISRYQDQPPGGQEFQVPDAYVPHGYVTFPSDDVTVASTNHISYREVTSPINPEDFQNSSGKALDDTHAFNKTGALTIKSSSSSSGGLVGALGLSTHSSSDSNEESELDPVSTLHQEGPITNKRCTDKHQPVQHRKRPDRQSTLRQEISQEVTEYIQGLNLGDTNQKRNQSTANQNNARTGSTNQDMSHVRHSSRDNSQQTSASQLLSGQMSPSVVGTSTPLTNILPVRGQTRSTEVTSSSSTRPLDLESFLTQLGLSKYFHIFQEQDVDLQVFLTLTENDLKEVGIKLFGPRRKMTSAIARWHSDARPTCSKLEQAYADGLEVEMQEMAIQLTRSCEQVEVLKAQVLQERELRSVAEGCLMEDRSAWQQVRHLAGDTRQHCVDLQQILSCARLYEEELSRRSDGTSAGEHISSQNTDPRSRPDLSSLPANQITAQLMHIHSEAQRHLVVASSNMDKVLGQEIDYSSIEGGNT